MLLAARVKISDFKKNLKKLCKLICNLWLLGDAGWAIPMSKKCSKIRQKDVFSVHPEDVLRGARMKVFITSFLDVGRTSCFGCYMNVNKRHCQDIIIEHPKDVIQGTRMKIITPVHRRILTDARGHHTRYQLHIRSNFGVHYLAQGYFHM